MSPTLDPDPDTGHRVPPPNALRFWLDELFRGVTLSYRSDTRDPYGAGLSLRRYELRQIRDGNPSGAPGAAPLAWGDGWQSANESTLATSSQLSNARTQMERMRKGMCLAAWVRGAIRRTSTCGK